MKIQTDIDNGSYKKFKEVMEKLKMTEYQLAQEAILVYINEVDSSVEKTRARRIMEFIKKDLLLE